MGDKITVDSATLANKALEVIEAHWLFGLPYDRIDVLVHPQSLVHGLVEFEDGTTLAQLAPPDMRLPIRIALAYPRRLPAPGTRLNLLEAGTLSFEEPDRRAFPLLELGREAALRGGTAPAVFSAANEEAVSLFLRGRIGFPSIAEAVAGALETMEEVPRPGLDAIEAAEERARRHVRERSAP